MVTIQNPSRCKGFSGPYCCSKRTLETIRGLLATPRRDGAAPPPPFGSHGLEGVAEALIRTPGAILLPRRSPGESSPAQAWASSSFWASWASRQLTSCCRCSCSCAWELACSSRACARAPRRSRRRRELRPRPLQCLRGGTRHRMGPDVSCGGTGLSGPIHRPAQPRIQRARSALTTTPTTSSPAKPNMERNTPSPSPGTDGLPSTTRAGTGSTPSTRPSTRRSCNTCSRTHLARRISTEHSGSGSVPRRCTRSSMRFCLSKFCSTGVELRNRDSSTATSSDITC